MKDKKSLLIVDDDIAHRTMLRILLDWQYEIIFPKGTSCQRFYRANLK